MIVLAEGRRPGEDAEQWEIYGLLHLCTCLFIVAAAGIQNLTGESQTADGLQMNFLQSMLTNYTRIDKPKGKLPPLERRQIFLHLNFRDLMLI